MLPIVLNLANVLANDSIFFYATGVTCSVPAVNVSPHRGTPYLPLVENGLPESLTAYLGTSFSSGAHSSHRSPLASANTGDRVVPSPVIVSSR